MQNVQLAMQNYYNLKRASGRIDHVVECFKQDAPEAVEAAVNMYKEKYLDKCAENDVPYGEVYDYIVVMVNSIK